MTKKEKEELKKIYATALFRVNLYGRLVCMGKKEYEMDYERERGSKNTIESFMLLIGIDAYDILTFEERNDINKEAYKRAHNK